jgi:hypothetical protein
MELDKTREQWRRAYSPISTREAAAWLQDWRDSLRSIPYMRVVKVADGGLLNMIELRAVLNIDGLNFDMVKADLERVWSGDVAKGLRATHCFRETGNGVVLYFAGLTSQNNYVTGVVHVSRKE